MKRTVTLIAVLFLLLGSFQTLQAEKYSFSLKEAQDYAIKNNYQARNAIIDVSIAARSVKENIATGLPQASAQISYNNFLDLATQLIPAEFFGGEPGTYMEVQFGTKHNATASAQLNQLLFSGSYIVGLQVASKVKEMSELQLEQVENDVKQAIANAYHMVLISERNKVLMQETVETMEKLLSDTKAMYEQGFIEETDVDKLNLLISDLQTNLMNAKNQLINAYHLLKFNLGLHITDEIELTDNLDFLLMAVDPSELLKRTFDLQEHVSFRLLDKQESISELQVRLAKMSYLPTLNAFLSRQENAQRNEFNFLDFDEKWFPTTLFGVQMNIPIFSSGQRLHQVKKAQLELEKMRNSKLQVRESLAMGAITAKNNFDIAVKTYRNKKKNFELAGKIYEKEQIRYKNGVSSSTDLNQSYNSLLEAQGTYLGSILDMFNKKYELDKAYSKL